MNGPLSLWPVQASAHATTIDIFVLCFTILIVCLSAPVFILITIFAIRYRRGRQVDREHAADRNVWIEISWTLIPFVLLLVFYVSATHLFFDMHRPPADAEEIAVVGKQWMWKFQHPTGQREINDLHVPTGQPIKLTMTSEDVIHSLFLPALRLKQDVLPGRYTDLWFTVDTPGTYGLACTQFCGTDHSLMGGRFIALSGQDYAQWLALSSVDGTLAAQGETLFRTLGCGGCHDAASNVRAPSLQGLAGRGVALASGETIVADDQYLRDSILLPNARVVAGYPAIMPTYQNVVGEEDLVKLIAYIKALKPGARGFRQ